MKIILILFILIFSSCTSKSTKRQVYKYQGEQTGKQYQYIFKPSPKTDKKELTSITYSGFDTRHYFAEEKSDHAEISIMHSVQTVDGNIAFGAYYYKGTFDIKKTLYDTYYSESLAYTGFGFRVNLANSFVSESKNIELHLLNLQFALNIEKGDYYDWRKKLNDTHEYFINENSSENTFSFHYVPEVEFHINEELDLGIFYGYERYYNKNSARSAILYGYKIRYSTLGLSIITSEMDYEHIYYVTSFPDRSDKKSTFVTKYQQRLQLSFLF